MIDEVECPYCGEKTMDLWETVGNPFDAENEGVDWECGGCGRTYHIRIQVDVWGEPCKLKESAEQ